MFFDPQDFWESLPRGWQAWANVTELKKNFTKTGSFKGVVGVIEDLGLLSFYKVDMSYIRFLWYVVVSQNRGTQYKPQNTMILNIGTPKMVPLIFGNYHDNLVQVP